MKHDRNEIAKRRHPVEDGLPRPGLTRKKAQFGKGADLFPRVLVLLALFFLFLLLGVVREEQRGAGTAESLAAPYNKMNLPPLPGSTPPLAPPKPLDNAAAPSSAGGENLSPGSPIIDSKVKQALKKGKILLNFENIDIQALTKLMSEITGRNIMIGKDVRANISILSSTEVTLAQAWKMYQSVLEASGYGAVDRGKYIEILPITDARKAKSRYISDRPVSRHDEYVVSIIVLKEANADALAGLLKPLASNDGMIAAYPQANALIISDRAELVSRLVKIVRGLDKRYKKMQLRIYHLEHATVREVSSALQSVFGQEKETAGGAGGVRVTANEQTNSLIILAYSEKFPLIEKILQTIDREKNVTEKPAFHLYYLENGDAETIAKVLSQMLQEKKTLEERRATETSSSSTQQVPGLLGKDERTFVSSTVSFDKDTNSLILYLTDTQFNEIKPLIAKLDAARRQVLISAVVAEVTLKKIRDIGVNLQALSGQGAAAWGGGMSQEALYSFLASGGFVFGGISDKTHTISIQGKDTVFPDMYYIMSLIMDDSNFNLLAAPRILTLDHKKAEISVGNVIPYAGGVKYDVQGQPIISYEYKNVGLSLKVTPHVSEGRTIRLEINPTMEEITDYLKPSVGALSYVVPITAKREVNTTISMVEGQTIVIGGLIYKKTLEDIKKVPILGDLPLLGGLFRNKTKSDEKTTLFIFLTPNIIDSPDELQKITQDYNDIMRNLVKSKEMKNELVMPPLPPSPSGPPAESPTPGIIPEPTSPSPEQAPPAQETPMPTPAPSPLPSPSPEGSSIFRSGEPR